MAAAHVRRSGPAFVLRGTCAVASALLLSLAAYFSVVFLQVRAMGAGPGTVPARSDVIVVMGAAQYDGTPSPMLEERLTTALALWKDGVAPVIAVTGGKMPADRFTEAATSRRWLTDRGVPRDAIVMEDTGRSTWESLRSLAPLLDDRGVRTVVMVTTDWHLARSTHAMRELGFAVTPAPAGEGRSGSTMRWVREAAGVGVGRVIGFGALERFTG
ncbi:MAG: YdcF family protein [Actinomycetota bacterium]